MSLDSTDVRVSASSYAIPFQPPFVSSGSNIRAIVSAHSHPTNWSPSLRPHPDILYSHSLPTPAPVPFSSNALSMSDQPSTSLLHVVPSSTTTAATLSHLSVYSHSTASLDWSLSPGLLIDVNYRTYSNPSPASSVSQFRSLSKASIQSHGSSPYDRPPSPDVLLAPLSSAETKQLIEKTAHKFSLLLINIGPALANENQKASMCRDAFLVAKTQMPGYGGIFR